MSEELKDKKPEELLRECFDDTKLGDLSEKQLEHWSNIMSSIVELRKLKEPKQDNSMLMWITFLVTLLPFPSTFNSLKEEPYEVS